MRLVRNIAAAKGAATLLMLTVPFLSDLLACCGYTIPYSLAVLYDDALVQRYGFVIIMTLVIYLVAFLFSQILMRAKHNLCMRIGLYCLIGVNLCDIVCAALSWADAFSIHKVINILLSITLVVLSILEIRKLKCE